MADHEKVEDKTSETTRVHESETRESIDEVLARQRKEISQLQDREIQLKKAAAKGSKAEQKAKKKQVEEEIARLSTDLKANHAKELASLGYGTTDSKDQGSMDSLVNAIAGVSLSTLRDQSKPSKGAKRREKRAQQEAAREQRIKEEQSNIVSDRMVENTTLEKQLEPLGLTIHEIKPDGHCMYRAIEHQLARLSSCTPHSFQELRNMVASYMRSHASDFTPFFLSENSLEDQPAESINERFEQYCKDIESTAAWGSQLELGALTHCLRKHIMVFSGSFPVVEMGKEYKTDGNSRLSIMLSYHKHAYGLGEHYNSVVQSSSS